jgi:hypothetical protein
LNFSIESAIRAATNFFPVFPELNKVRPTLIWIVRSTPIASQAGFSAKDTRLTASLAQPYEALTGYKIIILVRLRKGRFVS